MLNEMNICTLYKDSVRRRIPFNLSLIEERHLYTEDSMRLTLLHYAVMYSDLQMVTFLLEKGVSPNIEGTSLKRTPLFFSSDPDISVLLITEGAEVNYLDTDKNAPLHCIIERFSCEQGEKDTTLFFKNIKTLLWNDADPSIKNDGNVSVKDLYHLIFPEDKINEDEDIEVKEVMKNADDELSDLSESGGSMYSSVESLEEN
jgi:hypothetical protein